MLDELLVAIVDDVVGHGNLNFPPLDDHGQQIRAVLADSMEALPNLRILRVECAMEVVEKFALLSLAGFGIVAVEVGGEFVVEEQVALRHVFAEVALHHTGVAKVFEEGGRCVFGNAHGELDDRDELLKKGVTSLPTIGDGRQSGTAGSPSILNASPEAAAGGGLAILKTGDPIRIDLNERSVNMLVSDDELEQRRKDLNMEARPHQTPWQEIYRSTVGPLATGGCMELATAYQKAYKAMPRNNH